MGTRINLKFTDTNETQLKALEILKQHSHNKTQFISDCIVYYMDHHTNDLSKDDLKNVLMEVLKEISLPTQPVSTPSKAEVKAEVKPQVQKETPTPATPVVSVASTPEPMPQQHQNLNDTINNLDDNTMKDMLSNLELFENL